MSTTTTTDDDDSTKAAGNETTKRGDPGTSGEASGGGGSDGSSGGTGSGAVSSGGRASSAGAPTLVENAGAGGSCSCDAGIICEPGYVLSEQPGKCCRCVVDCLSVGCLELDCPAGSHAAQDDDECCPSCVVDQPLSCEEAHVKYDELRTELIAELELLGCTDDADCGHFWEDNRCNVTCGTVIPVAALDTIEDALLDFAEQSCTNCLQQQPIPCPRSFPPTCVDGMCR